MDRIRLTGERHLPEENYRGGLVVGAKFTLKESLWNNPATEGSQKPETEIHEKFQTPEAQEENDGKI